MGEELDKPEKTYSPIDNNNIYLKFGYNQVQGWKKSMEDYEIDFLDPVENKFMNIFGIFDGHGGREVPKYLKAHFMDCLNKNKNFIEEKYKEGITETFFELDKSFTTKEAQEELAKYSEEFKPEKEKEIKEINDLCGENEKLNDEELKQVMAFNEVFEPRNIENANIAEFTGATGMIIAVCYNQILIAYAGNSRCLVLDKDGKIIKNTKDHTMKDENEKKRVDLARSFNDEDEEKKKGEDEHMEYLDSTRGFGDLEFKGNEWIEPKDQEVSVEPQIELVPYDEAKYIIFGSHGMFEGDEKKVNDEVGKFFIDELKKGSDIKFSDIIQNYFEKIIAKDKNNDKNIGLDNMSCFLIELKNDEIKIFNEKKDEEIKEKKRQEEERKRKQKEEEMKRRAEEKKKREEERKRKEEEKKKKEEEKKNKEEEEKKENENEEKNKVENNIGEKKDKDNIEDEKGNEDKTKNDNDKNDEGEFNIDTSSKNLKNNNEIKNEDKNEIKEEEDDGEKENNNNDKEENENNDSIYKIIKKLKKARKGSICQELSIKEDECNYIIDKSYEIFQKEESLLKIQAPLYICGDIHGQYYDLLRVFDILNYPPQSTFLFLGDYVDRGKQSLECLLLLLCLKIQYPDKILLLRGNHECEALNKIYGFYDECKRRLSIKCFKKITNLFNMMPISALINENILCMHGGLSKDLQDIEQINKILRPTDIPNEGLLCDLLWSDPNENLTEDFGINERNISITFSKDYVKNFVEKNNLDLICRAHQVVEEGFEFFADMKLVTVFTAPNYMGEFDNNGGILEVGEDLLCKFHVLRPNFERGGKRKRITQLVN